jgi:hypothetical protein
LNLVAAFSGNLQIAMNVGGMPVMGSQATLQLQQGAAFLQ